MKHMSTLHIIFLSIIVTQTIISSDTRDSTYNQMSIENLKNRRRELVQQNITKSLNWTKEKECETCCGICCSLILPTALCSYIGYQCNNDLGLPIGTFIGLNIGSYAVSAFAEWYQPDYEESITELRTIQQTILAKQKEKTD